MTRKQSRFAAAGMIAVPARPYTPAFAVPQLQHAPPPVFSTAAALLLFAVLALAAYPGPSAEIAERKSDGPGYGAPASRSRTRSLGAATEKAGRACARERRRCPAGHPDRRRSRRARRHRMMQRRPKPPRRALPPGPRSRRRLCRRCCRLSRNPPSRLPGAKGLPSRSKSGGSFRSALPARCSAADWASPPRTICNCPRIWRSSQFSARPHSSPESAPSLHSIRRRPTNSPAFNPTKFLPRPRDAKTKNRWPTPCGAEKHEPEQHPLRPCGLSRSARQYRGTLRRHSRDTGHRLMAKSVRHSIMRSMSSRVVRWFTMAQRMTV